MKSKLKYHHKAVIDERFVVEITLHDISKSKKYPEGLKYGLICFDKKIGKK